MKFLHSSNTNALWFGVVKDEEKIMSEQHTFQAEIKQLLNILVHSLYTDREIFLRELISNASDALSKVQFEMLTNQNVLTPDAELAITLTADEENRTLRLTDTGIGMTRDEMVSNLGIIAQSGAKSFMERAKADGNGGADLIGQFGVGFYSVFMVADRVEVTSRSAHPDERAHTWISSGEDTYEIVPAEKTERGTEIVVYLREDAAEFATNHRLREIIKRHSDYVSFPIYLVEADNEQDDEAPKPVNQQTALWRRPSQEISNEEYNDFYRMLTLDFDEPVLRIHSQGDAPIQYYALLYLPKSTERNMFSLRKDPGLKLYARKVLIQEYTTALLPEYLQFVQGVVDSEDLPLNVNRESVQANPQIMKLKQVLTRRVLSELKKVAEDAPETYAGIWATYGHFLKHGVVSEYSDRERLLPLLRFYTSTSETELRSLESYVEQMKTVEGQEAIYYISAENVAMASRSPHLEAFRARGIEVLYMVESMDGFLVNTLGDYQGHKLVAIDSADLDLEGIGQTPEQDDEAPAETTFDSLVVRMRNILGEAVESVRMSKVFLGSSPARLVSPEGAIDRHTQRVYQMLERDFQAPARILELNPRHPIIQNLVAHAERGPEGDAMLEDSIQLLYENTLLAEGQHPNPAEMVAHIQRLLESATRP